MKHERVSDCLTPDLPQGGLAWHIFLNNPCPLFIDEVQKEPGVLEEIKLIVDESDERGSFILSDSQGLELMKGMSESLPTV